MVLLGVQDQNTILGDFVLESVYFYYAEYFIFAWWVLDADSPVVYDEFLRLGYWFWQLGFDGFDSFLSFSFSFEWLFPQINEASVFLILKFTNRISMDILFVQLLEVGAKREFIIFIQACCDGIVIDEGFLQDIVFGNPEYFIGLTNEWYYLSMKIGQHFHKNINGNKL